jgi:C-terminal processing protease CtpA/Prc
VIASLHLDNRILEIHDFFRFVRQTSSAVSDYACLAAYRAEYPNGTNIFPLAFYLSDSTFYLRITDFEDERAENMVKSHWKEIISRPYLIVDIRNNGGGLDEFFQSLLALTYTHPYKVDGVEWYASEGNLRNSQEAIISGDLRNGDEGRKWMEQLIAAMKKDPGGFVIHPDMGGSSIVKKDTIYPMPRKIGIIINEGNGSSAEQFILEAKESKKVTLFGNHNTAGVLDYSNQVREDFPSGNYIFFWPMTRSMRLPDHPIDNIGIPPDVIIPFPETNQLYGRLDDWVYFVKEYLEYKEN